MRNVGTHLLEDKMDDAVTHYINSHQSEPVHIDTNGIPMTVQEDGAGRVTVMHQQTFTTQMCRQVSVTEQVDGPWGEELLEGPIAAIVAHLQNTRNHPTHHKMATVRNDVDGSVILDGSMRYNGQTLEQHEEPIVVQLPPMQTLPPLQDIKRCETDWFTDKNKKEDNSLLDQSDSPLLETATASPHNKHNKKSLPHKKRISRKLKRNNGGNTPQQELVIINCAESAPEPEHEQILPDSFAAQHAHHIQHEVRPMYICQECGSYYGEEQLKFYQHLRQHYEPHAPVIIDAPELAMDKMSAPCMVDSAAALPDSIVELSLESAPHKPVYQQTDKHILYTDKTLAYTSNKMQYPAVSADKEPASPERALYSLEMYAGRGQARGRGRKHRLEHRDIDTKLEEMGEFSEPEDLMAGIQVCVDDTDSYGAAVLPHLTIENGHVHRDHARHWLSRGECCGAYCTACARDGNAPLKLLKEEVLQRIFDSEVSDNNTFADNIITEHDVPEHEHVHEQTHEHIHDPVEHHEQTHEHEQESEMQHEMQNTVEVQAESKKTEPTAAKGKRFSCSQCAREFVHRSSLAYHLLSHGRRQHPCAHCGKAYYTHAALKVHTRVHNGDRPYKCEECGKEFRQWGDLRYHKISLHSDKKHFKCEYCGKEFARKYSLSVHVRIHTGERNYPCAFCSKSFRASSYRRAHMRTHTGDRPHKCNQCEKSFLSAFDLKRHLPVHDKIRNRFEDIKTKSKDQKKTKMTDTKEETTDLPTEVKKIAVASTAKPQGPKKTSRAKKSSKKGAPNVTVQKDKDQFKTFVQLTENVETVENKHEFNKYKHVYSEGYKPHLLQESPAELATLRPIFRPETDEKPVYRENTDGKMNVFTNIEKNPQVLGDIRQLEREIVRDGEVMEAGFIERLTALYNIPAV